MQFWSLLSLIKVIIRAFDLSLFSNWVLSELVTKLVSGLQKNLQKLQLTCKKTSLSTMWNLNSGLITNKQNTQTDHINLVEFIFALEKSIQSKG